jgi:predicted nucleic acid-binding protein
LELVMDANIFLAALIRDSHTRHLIVSGELVLYAPEFLFSEIEKHLGTVVEKTGLSKEQIMGLIRDMVAVGGVKSVPQSEFKEYMESAEKLSKDPYDTSYLALALKLNCAVWSNDKRLKEQDTIKVLSTEEVIGMLSGKR